MIFNDNLIKDGKSLEFFTNACYCTMNYYVDCNLKVIEDKVDNHGKADVLELDVYARKFYKDHIIITLIECKRGCTFGDLFKFKGVSSLIGANENVMVCESNQFLDIKKQGDKLGINVVKPEELFLQLKSINHLKFDMYLKWNLLKNSVIDKIKISKVMNGPEKLSKDQSFAYNLIRSYISILIGEIWHETVAEKRAISILKLMEDNKDFVRKIARNQNITPKGKKASYYMQNNAICQAAGALVLDVKIAYIISAVECAILNSDTSAINDDSFKSIVNKMKSSIDIAIHIPNFLQYFICIFGGIYSGIGDDIKNISSFIGINVVEFNSIIVLLKELFTLANYGIQWGFEEDLKVCSISYVPDVYKAFGINNRELLGFDTSNFFRKSEWINTLEKWGEY